MDTTVIATIIAVLGTGFLAMLGFFLRGIRADIAAMRAEIGQVQQAIARLEATVAEHGRQLASFAGYGERITALETAVFSSALHRR